MRSGRFARGVDDDIIQQAAELLQRERAASASYSGAVGGGVPRQGPQDFPSLAAPPPKQQTSKEPHPMSLANKASQAKKEEEARKQKGDQLTQTLALIESIRRTNPPVCPKPNLTLS